MGAAGPRPQHGDTLVPLVGTSPAVLERCKPPVPGPPLGGEGTKGTSNGITGSIQPEGQTPGGPKSLVRPNPATRPGCSARG